MNYILISFGVSLFLLVGVAYFQFTRIESLNQHLSAMTITIAEQSNTINTLNSTVEKNKVLLEQYSTDMGNISTRSQELEQQIAKLRKVNPSMLNATEVNGLMGNISKRIGRKAPNE